MKKIRYCQNCDKYTMKEVCDCGGKSVIKIPPRYSPVDKTAKYRREAKKEILKEKGLL